MTGNDLIDAIAAAQEKPRTDIKPIVDALFAAIGDAAARGEAIAISGFGKFGVKATPARDGRHPRTGKPITIEAGRKITFKPASALRDRLK